jgi:hypothetical protein
MATIVPPVEACVLPAQLVTNALMAMHLLSYARKEITVQKDKIVAQFAQLVITVTKEQQLQKIALEDIIVRKAQIHVQFVNRDIFVQLTLPPLWFAQVDHIVLQDKVHAHSAQQAHFVYKAQRFQHYVDLEAIVQMVNLNAKFAKQGMNVHLELLFKKNALPVITATVGKVNAQFVILVTFVQKNQQSKRYVHLALIVLLDLQIAKLVGRDSTVLKAHSLLFSVRLASGV